MGATSSTQKLTVECISLLEQLEPSQIEKKRKRNFCISIERQLRRIWPKCKVVAFGSSARFAKTLQGMTFTHERIYELCSGFGFGGSDLDLAIFFEDFNLQHYHQLSQAEKSAILTQAAASIDRDFEIQEYVQSARVPILKLWNSRHQIACDLCVGGFHVVLNTAMMRYYGELDRRVRPLAFAVKYWAKSRGINDSSNGTLSSYGYCLLVIFYLQSRFGPTKLPCSKGIFGDTLEHCEDFASFSKKVENYPFPESSLHGSTALNVDSVGSLLKGFFNFYASEFDMERNVVNVREGIQTCKEAKWEYPVAWRLSIEDPFESGHDVARVIFNRRGQIVIMEEFRRANELLKLGNRFSSICNVDMSSWQATSSCYICNGSDHKARHCVIRTGRLDIGLSCWYCGEVGHTKGTCPLLQFLHIPKESDSNTAVSFVTHWGSSAVRSSSPTLSVRKKKKCRHSTTMSAKSRRDHKPIQWKQLSYPSEMTSQSSIPVANGM
uniref:Poly(A) polymerase putative n=1 Tax=Albugo laibachii Nc14 TaxID=890382 RepID=F0W3L3_9STRA|nr:Poly(A) polymerase putative [Albugo laibachii Nc14]|eukprot:CCA15656.1 Poly(A) polymerase putative [Albugo laibachii Nc14]